MQLTQQQIDAMKSKGLSDEKIKALALSKGYAMPKQGIFDNPITRSEQRFGQSIAGALGGVAPEGSLMRSITGQSKIDQANKNAEQVQQNLLQRIKEKRSKGEDTSRLVNALKTLDGEVNFYDILNSSTGGSLNKSAKQVFGEGFGVATDIIGAGSLPGGIGQITKPASGFLKGAGQGFKAGAIGGSIFGGAQGLTGALEEDRTLGESVGAGLREGAIGGIAGGTLGGIVGGISGKITANKELKNQTIKLLQERPDSRVAKYTIDGQGKLATDPFAREAIKQGLDEGTVSIIKGSSAQDKIKASKALDILVRGKTDPRFKALNRPSDVIGESVLDRFNIIQKANKTALSELDNVAKGLKGQKIDPTPAVQSFIDDLSDMGVSVQNGQLNFKGSDLEGLDAPQKVLNNLVKRMREVSDDGYELHRLKRYIDELVEYGKSGEGLSGRTENVMKGLRRNIDELLDTTSSAYNTTNTIYSETRNTIDDFISSAGSKFNPNDKNASAKIGTLARRILSNAQSRTDIINILQKLQDVAEKYGGKFNDDIITQTVFVNDLERLFGTSAPTSPASEVQKGFQRAGTIAGKFKNSTGIFDLALQATGEGIERARGINEQNLIKAIRQLLVN